VIRCEENNIRTALNPLVIDGVRYSRRECAPKPGKDTEYVLRNLLNLKDEVIQELRKRKVIE